MYTLKVLQRSRNKVEKKNNPHFVVEQKPAQQSECMPSQCVVCRISIFCVVIVVVVGDVGVLANQRMAIPNLHIASIIFTKWNL